AFRVWELKSRFSPPIPGDVISLHLGSSLVSGRGERMPAIDSLERAAGLQHHCQVTGTALAPACSCTKHDTSPGSKSGGPPTAARRRSLRDGQLRKGNP